MNRSLHPLVPRGLAVTATALLAWSCAAPGTARSGAVPGSAGPARAAEEPSSPRRSNRNEITEAEIRESIHANAHALIRALRPSWLRVRGASSMKMPEQIKVYQDGIPSGGLGSLSQISTAAIISIHYLDGMAATQRFGTDHGNGAILVRTRR